MKISSMLILPLFSSSPRTIILRGGVCKAADHALEWRGLGIAKRNDCVQSAREASAEEGATRASSCTYGAILGEASALPSRSDCGGGVAAF